MALNFNVDPYYDDFDPSKNFHRILFRPGYAVQARELTQSQTILQNQISNFADNIFSQNTPVTGGKVTTNLNCYYIKLNAQFNNEDIIAANFLNREIQDATGTVRAKVIATAEATISDPPTLVVSYYSGPQFSDALTVYAADGTNFAATTIGSVGETTCNGKSSAASISSGVFYVVNGYNISSTQNPDGTYSKYSIGNFVSVLPQTIILNKYSNIPSYRVGLSITETVVDYIADTSLLDPAVGASNYQAPGADRYQINLELITLPIALGNDDQFIELLRIENGKVIKQVDGTVYSVIDDYFAKRDFEANGDYVVDDFKLTPAANTINSNSYDLRIGKGLAYVHGYRIENQSDILLTSNRARTTDTILNNAVFIDYGSYFRINSANGTFDTATMPSIDLHCVANSGINSANTTTYASTLVGSAFIRNLHFENNTSDANTASYVFKAYVSDVSSTTLTGSATTGTATTITFADDIGKFSGTANAYYGSTIAITSGTSLGDYRKIVSYNASTKTATVDSPFTLAPDNTSNFSLLFSTSIVESLIARNSSNVIIATANIDTSGKVNNLTTGDTVLTNPNMPEMVFTVGNQFVGDISNSNYVSSKVFRSKSFTSVGGVSTLTITIPTGIPMTFLGTGTLSSDTIKQNFIIINKTTGKVLDFCSSGNTVVISAANKTVTFSSNYYTNPTVDVIAAVSISNADNVTNVLKTKNLISGNTTSASITGPSGIISATSYVDLTKGQVYIKNTGINTKSSLYVSDVKKLVKVIDSKDPTVDVSDAMMVNSAYDITNQFSLDDGQRDNFYDHASLRLVAGANKPKGNILVVFDFYSHTGGDGYFDVNSYLTPNSSSPELYQEIPSYTSTNGTTYRLTDSIDFRPSRKNAQATFAFEYTGNPAIDDTGILIPQNLNEYVSDYSYYLGRKDKLVLSKDKTFKFVEGTPSIQPIFPTEPDGSLVLADITLDPYTAYIPGEAPGGSQANLSINKVLHKNWVKSDITDLQTRVNNLEYYTSLSLLEQNAQSLQVPDVNGLNRFKNGILVDDFSSFLTADTSNADYAANVNTRKKQLSALTLVDNFQLQNPIVLNSLGTIKKTNSFSVSSIGGTHTNIFTLPYTTANVVVQQLASSTVSLNPFGVSIFQGVAKLNPPMDNWVDNSQVPGIIVTDPSIQIYQQTNGVNITNSGDFATIPGTTSSSTTKTSTAANRVITTNSTTTTYTSQLQNITTTGNYSQVSSTIGSSNGYLTNIAILPYIRPQQLIFKSKGLLVNAPVSTWFDGKNVDEFITSPNTIELTGVTGKFKEDDIVGFYFSNKFYPTGRVVSVYNYPSTTNVRLYVAALLGAPQYTSTNIIQNAIFNASGVYISSTASGTLNAATSVTQLTTSGAVSGVGGSYTPVGGSSVLQVYKVQNSSGWGTFLNQYGVWGDLNRSATYSASFVINAPTAATYTIYGSATGLAGGAVVKVDGVSKLTLNNPTTTSTVPVALTAGDHTFSWIANNTAGTPAGIAVIAKDAAGNIVFDSTSPPNLIYDSVAQEIVLPKGGAWFTGVTKFKLDGKASNVEDYYVGSKVSVTSKFLYQFTTETATYVPPSPAKSGGGGGGCFTEDTMVMLDNGKKKKISEISIGDRVLNWNKTEFNRVLFIERIMDTDLKGLYAPRKSDKPFATLNHPIYIDGELSSIDSEAVYEMYPWLGKTKQFTPFKTIPAQNKLVYNLWTDGDGTYTVNGYGTTSIIGTGGVLRLIANRNQITEERAASLLVKFTNAGKSTVYGAYLLNNYFGKVDNAIANSILVKAFKDDNNIITQKAVMTLFKVVGKLACIITNK